MDKRMNKQEVIDLLENLGIDLDECWVLSSAALVIRDMFPDAGDLDLAVTEKGLEQLKAKYNLIKKDNGFYIVNDKVECVVDTKEPYKIEKYGKYNLLSLEAYFDFLKNSKREKDKVKYDLIKPIIDKSEYLDLYDENRNLTGEKVLRYKKMHPQEGRYIIITIVFIQNSEGKFLIQKTSKEKGSVYATTGGLVKSGSTSQETIKEEIKEELGIEIDDVKCVYEQKREFAFQDCYYVKKDIDIKDITVQEEEVDYVCWLSVEEINDLIEKGLFRKGNIEAFKYITKQ